MNLLDALHFVRPDWLWALLLLPLAMLARWYRRRRHARWHDAVDPHLLPHVTTGGKARGGVWGTLALLLGLLLAVVALAGPSWRQVEQPLWESKTPLVILLDLSSSIRTPDLPPSRLLQARAKLATLLRERKGGEVALVAYAWEPFTVAPLTDDAANVALFLDALTPEVMPVDGQKLDKALAWAGTLLKQSGARQGDVLVLTDHADGAALAAAAPLRAAGYRVSVLGLGSLQGASYRDVRGEIEHAHLEETSLHALAAAGGGSYRRIAPTDADLQALDVLEPQVGKAERGQVPQGTSWQDEGYWLLLPLLLLGALAFRRPRQGAAAVVLCLLLPTLQPAHAATPVRAAVEPGTLWQRADQRQHQRLNDGVDAYRAGDFGTAQKRFEGIDTDQGWYNLGNALARQGKYDDAIKAYDRALQLHPGMPDAVANRQAVDAARKRRGQQGQQGQQGKPNQQDRQGQQQSGQQQSGQQQSGQQQSGQQQSGQQQQGNPGQQSQQNGNDPRSQQQGQGRQSPSDQQQPQDGSRQGQQGRDGQQRRDQGGSGQAQPQQPLDAENGGAQQQADAAQRERMAQAMRQQADAAREGERAAAAARAAMTPEQRERQQALDAWMQRVPDEPGNLLKAKFQLEYERRMREQR
jgi:Ca-activated chloride channel family protein